MILLTCCGILHDEATSRSSYVLSAVRNSEPVSMLFKYKDNDLFVCCVFVSSLFGLLKLAHINHSFTFLLCQALYLGTPNIHAAVWFLDTFPASWALIQSSCRSCNTHFNILTSLFIMVTHDLYHSSLLHTAVFGFSCIISTLPWTWKEKE